MKIGNPADKPASPAGAPAPPRHGQGRPAQPPPRPPAPPNRAPRSSCRAPRRRCCRAAPPANSTPRRSRRIAQAIADGRFKVNAEAIADKLIANAQELLGKVQALMTGTAWPARRLTRSPELEAAPRAPSSSGWRRSARRCASATPPASICTPAELHRALAARRQPASPTPPAAARCRRRCAAASPAPAARSPRSANRWPAPPPRSTARSTCCCRAKAPALYSTYGAADRGMSRAARSAPDVAVERRGRRRGAGSLQRFPSARASSFAMRTLASRPR